MRAVDHLPARLVVPGDRIKWCGQWVGVEDVQMVPSRGPGSQKPGRKFRVSPVALHDGRRLPPRYVHYLYDELVKTEPGGAA